MAPSYNNRASGFPGSKSDATAGTGDMARLYDSPGNDSFTADSDFGLADNTATGGGHVVKNFRYVYAYSTCGRKRYGDVDRCRRLHAEQTPSRGDPTYAALSGTAGSGYYNRAVGFDSVGALSSGNTNDIARLYDSPGNDTFERVSDIRHSQRPGILEHRPPRFRNVYAYSQAGGTDIANLYGSSGDDTFFGGPDLRDALRRDVPQSGQLLR